MVEDEGTSAVLPKDVAESLGLPYEFTCAMITLQAQSRLDSVGLTARVASVLAEAGISCNVVAGHFHDHLFVPAARGEEAVRLLQGPAVTA